MLGGRHRQEETGEHEEEEQEAGHAEQAAPMEEDIHVAQPYQGEPYHGYHNQQVPSYDHEEERVWRTDMLDRIHNVEGRVDRIDDQLQTLHETCTYQWNSLHDSYDSDMYDINTRLSQVMLAQESQLAHSAGNPFHDPRADIADLEAQRESEKEAAMEAKRSRRKSFSWFKRGSSSGH